MRVIVIGGGYAGMAVVIGLRRAAPDAEIHVVDPREHHLKLTQLQQTLRRPLDDIRIPFARLARRYHFTHHRSALSFDEATLRDWQWNKALPLPAGPTPFDYLVIATGAGSRRLPGGRCVYTQEDFCRQEGRSIIDHMLTRTEGRERQFSVVGAGATGVQFLFELNDVLQSRGVDYRLRLLSQSDRLLPGFPRGFHDYILTRLRQAGVDYLPQTRYRGQRGTQLELENTQTGETQVLPSDLTLLFPGVAPQPYAIQANRYGQALAGDALLPNIFAAGDCARFASRGLNALSAQAAVRKGKQVVANILRLQQKRLPYIYAYDELGYFVSLGSWDGVGWLLLKLNVLSGLAASVIKEAIEAQYDLFVDGLDLYF